MGILARAFAASEGDLLDNSGVWTTTDGFMLQSPTNAAGVTISEQRARQISAVMACIRVLAEDVASLPLHIYRRTSNDGRDRATGHPLYDVLHRMPNRWQTSFEWRELMMYHVLMRGNAYSEIITGPRGFADQLIPLHPDRIRPFQINGKMAYEYTPLTGKPRTLLQHEVFHVRGLSDDGIVGLFPLEIQKEVFGTAIATEDYGASLFRNGAQIGGVLSHPKQLGATGRDRLRTMLRDFTGSRKAFKTLVVEDDMKFTPMSMRARDAEFLASRKFSVIEICRAFRMQPHKIQDLERSTFSNIEHQSIEHVVDTLRPWLVRWEQAISRDLILRPQTFFAEFNVDGLLRGDIASRYSAYGTGIEKGFLTRNEVRRKENLNPLPGLDEPLTAMNMAGGSPAPDEPDESNSGQREARFIRAAAGRLANKEITAVHKAVTARQGADLEAWLDQFYTGYAADLTSGLMIPHGLAVEFALAAKQTILSANGNMQDTIRAWEYTRAGTLTELVMTEAI